MKPVFSDPQSKRKKKRSKIQKLQREKFYLDTRKDVFMIRSAGREVQRVCGTSSSKILNIHLDKALSKHI